MLTNAPTNAPTNASTNASSKTSTNAPSGAADAAPLYRQIYLRFRRSIADGLLQPGDRVPSVRALAAEMNVARGTVETAYQLLIGEGYLIARGPAGTVVSPQIKPTIPTRAAMPTSTAKRGPGSVPASVADTSLPASASTSTAPYTAATPSTESTSDTLSPSRSQHFGTTPLPFQMGLPALDAFPHKVWNRLVTREMRRNGTGDLVYPDPRGYAPLRSAIATYLGISRGIVCTPAQVFVCAGYRASLELICRSVMQRDDLCWFEEPGYFMARTFLRNAGMQLVPVPVDEEGLDVSAGVALAPHARFAVVTPSHQSPTGVSLSLSRRHALLAWANAADSWIIEDDYDSEYRYQGRPLPALKSLDATGRVLYTGTFSKVLTPGLRLSYLVVPEAQVERFAQIADEMQNHCPRLFQATLTTFMEDGYFARHISKMRSVYADRREWLASALRSSLGISSGTPYMTPHIALQAGGMHLLVLLDASSDDRAIAVRAQLQGLAVQALSLWHANATSRKGLLLGFTNVRSIDEATILASRLAAACSL